MLNKLNIFFFIALLVIAQTQAFSHGITGKRLFPTTMLIDDPFMTDELSFFFNYTKLENEFSGRINNYDISGEFAKTLLPHFGFSVGDDYQFINSDVNGTQSGFGNLEAGVKYQFLTNAEH